MQFHRHGEEQQYPFRSRRLCNENGGWYFNTREGPLSGPYRDSNEARLALAVFLAQSVHALPPEHRLEIDDVVGVQDNVQELVRELNGFYETRDSVGDLAALAWANNRITHLRRDWEITHQKDRIDVLTFAMNHSDEFVKR